MMRIYCLSHKHPAALFTFLLSYELNIRLSRDFSRISENVLKLKSTCYLCPNSRENFKIKIALTANIFIV